MLIFIFEFLIKPAKKMHKDRTKQFKLKTNTYTRMTTVELQIYQ